MVSLLLSCRSEEDEDEACWDRDLSQVTQHYSFTKSQESNDGMTEEVHLTNQDVGGLSSYRDLLQEVLVELQTKNIQIKEK